MFGEASSVFQHRSSFAVPFTSFWSEDDGKNPPVPPPTPPKPEKPQFDETQQKHINDLLAAERKTAEERTEQRLKDDATKREQDAKAEADRKAAEDRGAFEEVKQSLTKERDDAKAALEAANAKLGKLEERATKRVETLKAGLPAEAVEDFPAEADPLTQEEWLESRSALIAKLAPATQQNGHPRVPATPPAQGNVKPDIRENLKQSGIRYT